MYEDLESGKITLEKDLGQTLTPSQIVDYMVAESVKAARESKPEGVIQILDPACGTGRFMLGVADYCSKNDIEYLMWNIDIDPAMFDATVRHAVFYKIPAVVILGDALLNKFEKAVSVRGGSVSDIPIEVIWENFPTFKKSAKIGVVC